MATQINATLRALNTATETELAETLILLQDAKQAFQAMQLWFRRYSSSDEVELAAEDAVIADALFRDAIVQFVGCFDRSAKHPLDEPVLFQDLEGGPEYIAWLRDIRDSYAAHKFGSLRQCVAGVFVSSAGAVLGVGHLWQRSFPCRKEEEDQMLRCIGVVGKYLEGKVAALEEKLLAEAQERPADELSRLPNARTYATATDEIRISRDKLKSRRRSSA